MFTGRLKIPGTHGTVETPVYIPKKYFENVLVACSPYQNAVLKRLEILSFSYDPEWCGLLSGDLLV